MNLPVFCERLLLGLLALTVTSCASTSEADNGPWVPGNPALNSVPSIPRAPRQDTTVVFWQEELQGLPGVHIFARNDRSVPMRVTKVTVYECVNIQGGCIEWDPDAVLAPGERRRVYTILPSNASRAYRFRWRAFYAGVL
jgi:hypothetical protein